MRLNDRVTVSDFALTSEGYLAARAQLSRTGIQEYYGFEIGAEDSDRTYKIYRPAYEVFDPVGEIDGHYGPIMARAVAAFQDAYQRGTRCDQNAA